MLVDKETAGSSEAVWRLLRALVMTVVGGFALLAIGSAGLMAAPDLLGWVEDPAFEAWRTVLAPSSCRACRSCCSARWCRPRSAPSSPTGCSAAYCPATRRPPS
ncbi:hypothetical protein GCM10010441_27370 [Kitasatospora paracochleata]